jgi:hypothetical protein
VLPAGEAELPLAAAEEALLLLAGAEGALLELDPPLEQELSSNAPPAAPAVSASGRLRPCRRALRISLALLFTVIRRELLY